VNAALTSAPDQDEEVRQRILAGFRGTVPPLKPAFGYRLALAGAAGTMLLMPVLYAALVGGAIWGIWLYLSRVDFASVISEYHVTLLPLWFLPPALGLVVVICLIKPLFIKSARQEGDLRLDPAQEPFLFEFVGHLCKALQAPVPKEIHVDCQVNAAASFRRGRLPLFSNDMVLLIGLPLAESLTVQQLAGVIAHEVGHFGQKAGLRLSILVRILNAWLLHLVYQRDRFDAMIENGARQDVILIARLIFQCAGALVWLSRQILRTIMLAGHMVSSFVMRHLEYDADRYQVRLAGFSSLDGAIRELFALGAAYQIASSDLQKQWRERRLVDNLPRLVMANRQSKVRQIAAALEIHLSSEQEEIFATHPTARQRIAQALREKGVGVFSSDLPATALFADLPALERAASLTFYRSVLGKEVRPADLIPVEALRDREKQGAEERSALARFFQNTNMLRGIPIPARLSVTFEDRASGARLLEEARRAVAESSADHTRAIAEHRDAVRTRFDALRADALLKAGYSIQAGNLGNLGDRRTAMRTAEQAKEQMGALGPILADHERIEVRRLEAALALLNLPEVASRLPDVSVTADEMARLLACGAFLSGRFPRLLVLREASSVLDALTSQLKPGQENPPELVAEIRLKLSGFRQQMKELHRALRAQAYPFDHGRQDTTLAQFVIPFMPADDDLQGLIAAADEASTRMMEIEQRLLGRLAWLAEKVEGALGMPPLGRSVDVAVPPTTAQKKDAEPVPHPAAHTTVITGTERRRIAESKAEAVESREAFLRFFRNPLELRPIPLPEQAPEQPADPQAAIEGLWAALLSLKKEMDENARRIQQYRGAEQRWTRAIQAEELLHAGFTLVPEDFGLVTSDLANAARVRDRSITQMESLEPALGAVEEVQRQRIIQGLALLGEPQVAARVDSADRWRSEVQPLLAAAANLHRHFPGLRELRRSQFTLGILGAQGQPATRQMSDRVALHMATTHRQLKQLQRDLHTEPYPFDHAGESPGTLAQKMIPGFPDANDFNGIYVAMNHALRELADLHRRTLGRLAGIAERVERASGLG
jgi:Zn-dependent protease with chaperone function